jgi:hypothetical protein
LFLFNISLLFSFLAKASILPLKNGSCFISASRCVPRWSLRSASYIFKLCMKTSTWSWTWVCFHLGQVRQHFLEHSTEPNSWLINSKQPLGLFSTSMP